MRTLGLLCLSLSLSAFTSAEERLSWFTTDPEIKKSIFVPKNLPEGKEENRVLPWVFHSDEDKKLIQLKCIMRGYNASNNPSDYKDARWSHPGFSDNQVDTSAPADNGTDEGVPYRIWTIKINTKATDAGKKWATCEFQQGDFPLSTDFQFLIFRKQSESEDQNEVSYDFGEEVLEAKDVTQKIEDDLIRQVGEHYNRQNCSFAIAEDRKTFSITFCVTTTTTTTTTTTITTTTTTTPKPAPTTPATKPITTRTTAAPTITTTATNRIKSTTATFNLNDNNCPVISFPNGTKLTISPSLKGELCSDGQIYNPHPTNCDERYKCFHGKPILRWCGPGYLYDENLGYCEWDVNYVHRIVFGYSFGGRLFALSRIMYY